MADASFSDLKAKFNTRLRDTGDVTFSTTEKDEMLTEAFNDPYVASIVRDSSTTTVALQGSYTIPSGITSILELRLDYIGDGYGDLIGPSTYREIDGTIYFERENKYLPAGKPLIFVGRVKYDVNDLIPDEIQDYVLHLAMVTALETLVTSFTNTFLTNDTSMDDLLKAIGRHEQRIKELRKSFLNKYTQVV